jgi:hypothetical protein
MTIVKSSRKILKLRRASSASDNSLEERRSIVGSEPRFDVNRGENDFPEASVGKLISFGRRDIDRVSQRLSALQSAKQKIKQFKSSALQLPTTTIIRAEEWLNCLEQVVISSQLRWLAPLINVSPNDEIVFEWWNGEKKLVIYIEEDSADYIQVWGADIDDEMSDGQANNIEKIDDLWHWLLG